ncbi:MAG TPA: hypothetical protein VHT02_10650 [Methylocella sp.]|nr:hypothetical protein [Methylocella sp.]
MPAKRVCAGARCPPVEPEAFDQRRRRRLGRNHELIGRIKAGLIFDIMTASFFPGRWPIKPAPNSGTTLKQDRLFIALSRQAANATDFFAIPSDRVDELDTHVTV